MLTSNKWIHHILHILYLYFIKFIFNTRWYQLLEVLECVMPKVIIFKEFQHLMANLNLVLYWIETKIIIFTTFYFCKFGTTALLSFRGPREELGTLFLIEVLYFRIESYPCQWVKEVWAPLPGPLEIAIGPVNWNSDLNFIFNELMRLMFSIQKR